MSEESRIVLHGDNCLVIVEQDDPDGYQPTTDLPCTCGAQTNEERGLPIQQIDQTDADILLTVMGKKPLPEEGAK